MLLQCLSVKNVQSRSETKSQLKAHNSARVETKPAGLTLVRGASQLVTLRGPPGPRRGLDLRELHVIRDGAVLIRNGIIEEVGPTRRLENMSSVRGAHEVDASGRVVMPAFVDSQTSIVSLDRVNSEISDNGIQNLEGVSIRRLNSQAERITHSMARHGTGSIQSYVEESVGDAAAIKILRGQKFLDGRPVQIVSALFATSLDKDILTQVHERKLASIVELLCDAAGCAKEPARVYLSGARALGYLIKVQGDPLGSDHAVSLALEVKAHAVSHLYSLSASRILELAKSSVIATLLPGVHFQNGNPYDPGRALVDAGGAIALASGSHPESNPSLNMQRIIGLATRHLGLTAEEAISAATINGAHATGLNGNCGSIEPGKNADLIILNVTDYRELSTRLGTNNVYMTILRGLETYREGAIRVSGAVKN